MIKHPCSLFINIYYDGKVSGQFFCGDSYNSVTSYMYCAHYLTKISDQLVFPSVLGSAEVLHNMMLL